MDNPGEHSYHTIKGHMARGAAWMVAMRWTLRAVGVVNTIILARLLSPDDFGLIAMAMIVYGFLEALSEFNIDMVLLRDRGVTRAHYDTAWTIQIITGLVKLVILLAAAPLLATYYNDPRVVLVIQIIALRPAIKGFENIGQVEFRRDLDFVKEYKYWVYRRLVAFVLTLAIVLVMRDYVALALSLPLTAAVDVVLSFLMSKYRPRLSLKHGRGLFSFSLWWTCFTSVRFVGERGDEFVLGGVVSSKALGTYFIASDIAKMVVQEVSGPVNRALVPTMAKLTHAPADLRRAFSDSLGLTYLICMASGVGLAAVAARFVPLVLGDQWRGTVPLFEWLALAGGPSAVIAGTLAYFVVTKREKVYAGFYAVFVAVLMTGVILAARLADLEAVAMVRTVITGVMGLAMLGLLVALRALTLRESLAIVWRPTVASAVMLWAVQALPLPPAMWNALALAIEVGVGGLVFLATTYALWLIAGRPPGAEAALVAGARKVLRRWL